MIFVAHNLEYMIEHYIKYKLQVYINWFLLGCKITFVDRNSLCWTSSSSSSISSGGKKYAPTQAIPVHLVHLKIQEWFIRAGMVQSPNQYLWSVGHGFGVAEPNLGHILCGPIQPEWKKASLNLTQAKRGLMWPGKFFDK